MRLFGGQPVAESDAELLYALARRIPVARSALKRPHSDASYASRRTAPSRRLIVPGAR
jgi:hypothetical protein